MTCQVLKRANLPDIAYQFDRFDDGPVVLFCPGYRSDMSGTKASAIAAHARDNGINLLRFDYSGHGQSGGVFEELTLSHWVQDAADIMDHTVGQAPVIIIGSSMGGWVGLLLAMGRPDRVRALIGIAAAPDFTRTMDKGLTAAQLAILNDGGVLRIGSTLGNDPYVITKALIDDGEGLCLLDKSHDLAIPMVLLQGRQDPAVSWETPAAIERAFPKAPIKTILIDDGDHSLSRPQDLAILYRELERFRGA